MTSKAKYVITGNTFERKAQIKKAGGKWNAISKCWTAELYGSDSIFRYEGTGTYDLVFTKDEPKVSDEQAYDNLHNEGGEGYNPHR